MSEIKKNGSDLLKIEIGKRIDFIRTQNNMSKEKFAKLINITGQHLGKVINGESGLSIEKIIELSEKTGYTTDFILLGKKDSFDKKIKNSLTQAETDIENAYNKLKNIAKLIK